MNLPLPEEFVGRMKRLLGPEAERFFEALEAPPTRGIRINPLKPVSHGMAFWEELEKIPWEEAGRFLEGYADAGTSVIHEAGGFYLQDPAAMLPGAVLEALPGEKILDLCSAPGGKATQIGTHMRGTGLLVCNEPNPGRAAILSRNIERMGIPNAIAVSAWPEQLADRWPEYFDGVIVDAPCSGEGMFRKNPGSRAEWSAAKAAGCAKRQQDILEAAARLLRPGGRLVYSTCTWNPDENEETVCRFVETHRDFSPEAFSVPMTDGSKGWFTCYPHQTRGEGQFVARLRKNGLQRETNDRGCGLPRPDRNTERIFRKQFPYLPAPDYRLGNTLISLPPCPDLQGLRILRAGLHLGEVRNGVAFPDHAAAMSFAVRCPNEKELTGDEAERFIAGETVSGDETGWMILRGCGLALGWGKGSGGTIRNHYPKGLRNGRIHAETKA